MGSFTRYYLKGLASIRDWLKKVMSNCTLPLQNSIGRIITPLIRSSDDAICLGPASLYFSICGFTGWVLHEWGLFASFCATGRRISQQCGVYPLAWYLQTRLLDIRGMSATCLLSFIERKRAALTMKTNDRYFSVQLRAASFHLYCYD